MGQIDYLLIGHMTCDLTPEGDVPGGTVTYSGRVAAALGCQTAVLTSTAPHFTGLNVLTGLQMAIVPAERTTTFENVYTPHGRNQTIHAVANTLTPEHLPADWRNPAIVHFAPVVHEVDLSFIRQFPNSLICLTPQGWLREWGADGRVRPGQWAAAREVLALADIVVLSHEDLPLVTTVWQYWQWSKILVLTGGEMGCVVFQGETAVHVPTLSLPVVELTGAGDIFATACFIRYQQSKDILEAARFANFIAAHSVTKAGIEAVVEVVKTAAQDYAKLVAQNVKRKT
jgi:sugar/nucleoside kinase (ribokinase family)